MQDRSKPSTFRRLLLLAASLLVGAIGWFLLGEPEAVIAEENGGESILARVNGVAITEQEIMDAASADLMKLQRQKHDIITNYMNNRKRELLIEQAAEKKGLSKEAYLKAEVEDKLGEVAQTEVDAFYNARKQQIRQPKENVEKQIRELLAREAMFKRLEGSADIEVLFEPMRVEVAAVGPSKGPAGAPVQIVEFSDFECPFCGRVNPSLKQVRDNYGDKVRIVFRQFPLNFHPNAFKAGEASLCAAEQNEDYFWKLHDAMFADQKNLGVDGLKQMAAGIEGLETDVFNECLDSSRYASQVEEDMAAGSEAGVSGTPAFFINGRFLSGAQPYEKFAEIIDDELRRSKSKS